MRINGPYTAGGGTDAVARGLAHQLSEVWGQQVVVENRPGGSTMIGANAVAKADDAMATSSPASRGFTLVSASESLRWVSKPATPGARQ